MHIITLTTDLGLKDYYVAAIKGSILKELPNARIVDVTHEIKKYNVPESAFVVRNVFNDFPEGSIHIIGVRSFESENNPHVAILYRGHFFLGCDNGMFSLIFDDKPDKIIKLQINKETEVSAFPTKEVFVKAATHLARGGTIEMLGNPVPELSQAVAFQPVIDQDYIRGNFQYIDSYGNLITNINQQLFNRVGQNRKFKISFRNPRFEVNEISRSYEDVLEGDILALFGSSGFLEICINAGSATRLLGLKLNETVSIEFYDH
ncbi:SAM hydrolase/SAM-dependent halogenase family protein [Salibacter halophilus]|uniref:SAM-dependent chlorinase/fluorinase n=1 Tax=Salibacter halophilus TaxID=1803916 RepID=A0A6N6M7N6_9FLAO|nr:SAM-dependent chlorinase/fluorinase [Salibacter halophilus]KAB1066090.1 SAM-dependent chlorinase/fluorinase [Salibacter halophilus]